MNKALFVLCLSGLAVGCKRAAHEQAMRHESAEQKVYCVGRHTISIPNAFAPSKITSGNFRERGIGPDKSIFEVEARALAPNYDAFPAEIDKRRSELKARGDGDVEVLRRENAVGDDGVMFRVQRIDDAYISEVNILRGTTLLKVSLKSYGNRYEAAEQRLLKFVAGIHDYGSTPRPGGFCLGSLTVTGDFDFESANFLFRDDRGDDFEVDINSGTGSGKKQDTLLSRMASPDSLLRKFGVHETVLRARKLTVAEMRAEEWLGWTNVDPRQGKTFGFALETYPDKAGKDKPYLIFSLDTGNPLPDGAPTRNWMSNQQAVQLWDSVVGSVRVAKGGP